MTLAEHIPTVHATCTADGGKGQSWLTCSCGEETLHRFSLDGAWADFYAHVGIKRNEDPPRDEKVGTAAERAVVRDVIGAK